MGSHATLGGWEPKTCSICGDKIVLSGNRALMFEMNHTTNTVTSTHYDCWRHMKDQQ